MMKTRTILAALLIITGVIYCVLPASAGHKDIIDYPGYHLSPLDSPLQPTNTPPAFPTNTPPPVVISTPLPTGDSEDVATEVTLPVEQPQYRYRHEQGQANGR